jgi:hypothetical protein
MRGICILIILMLKGLDGIWIAGATFDFLAIIITFW